MSSRICYVPPILPDELLYSFLARLQAYNALWDPKIYLEQLFGTKDIIPGIDLPTRIDALAQYFGQFSLFEGPEDLINTTTLYPYHRPFLTIERHNAVQHILLFGGGKGLKVLMGRVANRFGANSPLRYCICCHQEDIDKHGVPFWHRSHQLPGITCCATHHLDLVVYATPDMLTDRRRLILPPRNLTGMQSPAKSRPDQIRFAQLSKDLLEAKLPALNPLLRQRAYREAIQNHSFYSRGKGVDYDALTDALRCHYEDFIGFAHRSRLLATPTIPLSWLRPLFDRPSRSSHPICHLLLIGFLFGSIDDFRRAFTAVVETDTEFIPELCQENYRPETNALPTQHDQLLRDTSISCRKLAKLLNISVTTVVIRRRALGIPISERRKNLDVEKLTVMKDALAKGLSPPVIAKQYEVSISSVYRLLAASPALMESRTRTQHDIEKIERRRIWQHAVDNNQNVGVKVIRATAADTYAWLYRHDRIWLQRLNATLKTPCKRARRVNWAARDAELCSRLEQYVYSLKSHLDRPRISKTLMLAILGDAMVRANMTRLPHLQALLTKQTESQQEFQIFRIECAIQQLAAQGLPIKLWRIQRLAGIREFNDTLRAHACKIIDTLPRKGGTNGITT